MKGIHFNRTIFNENAYIYIYMYLWKKYNWNRWTADERENIQDFFIDTSSDFIFHPEISNGDLSKWVMLYHLFQHLLIIKIHVLSKNGRSRNLEQSIDPTVSTSISLTLLPTFSLMWALLPIHTWYMGLLFRFVEIYCFSL